MKKLLEENETLTQIVSHAGHLSAHSDDFTNLISRKFL